MTRDTQVTVQGAGDRHIAVAWWIPNEFWEAFLSRDSTTNESQKQAMLQALSGISLLAVLQGDISTMGAFNFYTKEEIEQSMTLSFSAADGNKYKLSPLQSVAPDLEVVIGVIKPVLASAMGNLGNNMHFYVLNDKTESSPRLLDPYQKGRLDIKLKNRDAASLDARIEMPVNALFRPRTCPNGKVAHISWSYCPWGGERLED